MKILRHSSDKNVPGGKHGACSDREFIQTRQNPALSSSDFHVAVREETFYSRFFQCASRELYGKAEASYTLSRPQARCSARNGSEKMAIKARHMIMSCSTSSFRGHGACDAHDRTKYSGIMRGRFPRFR